MAPVRWWGSETAAAGAVEDKGGTQGRNVRCVGAELREELFQMLFLKPDHWQVDQNKDGGKNQCERPSLRGDRQPRRYQRGSQI